MRRGRPLLSAGLLAAGLIASWMPAVSTAAPQAKDEKPVVLIDTNLGAITVELDPAKAPISVANFLKYVDKGYYDGMVFHRVISDFMIQGGGMKEVGGVLQEQKPAFDPIKNESGNGLSNTRGTIAMARTPYPDSATSQFYINLFDKNAANLDGRRPGTGYAVFGKVIAGMEVVDAIAKTPTTVKNGDHGPMPDVPAKAVIIKSIKRKTLTAS